MRRFTLAFFLFGCAAQPVAAPRTTSAEVTVDLLHPLLENAWYLQTKDNEARLFVTSLGHGPRVVVLHGGWGANLFYTVRAVEPHLGAHEFILFDQRGSLLSPTSKPETLSVDELVEDLETLRVALGEDKLTLMAHSMGTRLAIEYARKYPDHIASLTLLGSVPPRGTKEDWEAIGARAKALEARAEVKAALEHEGVANVDPHAPASRASTTRWKIAFAAVNVVRMENWRKTEGGMVFYDQRAADRIGPTAPPAWDLAEFLGERRIPISVIQGDRDYVDPSASEWRSSTCVEVDVIPGAGHRPWLDDEARVADGVRRALSRRRC